MYHQGPPRHALSMCHTIQDTSLKQIHKWHTFTHENLKHTISDPVVCCTIKPCCNSNNHSSSKIFSSDHATCPLCSLWMYMTCPPATCVCTRPVLMQPMYNLRKLGLLVFCNFKTFTPSDSSCLRKMLSDSTSYSLIDLPKDRP
jgi:hypothetical protein